MLIQIFFIAFFFGARLKINLEKARPPLLEMPHGERIAQLAGMAQVAISAIHPQIVRLLLSFRPHSLGFPLDELCSPFPVLLYTVS